MLRDEYVGDERLGRQATLDHPIGGGHLLNAVRAATASVLRSPRHEHVGLARHIVEAFGDILADDLQSPAAAGARFPFGLDADFLAQ